MNRTPGDTSEARAKYWTKIISTARRDPYGVTAFLKHKDISKDNYYQWFKKLRKERPDWYDLSGPGKNGKSDCRDYYRSDREG